MAAGLCCESTRDAKSKATEPRIPAKHRDGGEHAAIFGLVLLLSLSGSFSPPSGHVRHICSNYFAVFIM